MRPRVLAPLWGLKDFGRFRPQFEALSKHVDLQFVYYYSDLKPSIEGATFKQVRPPREKLLHFEDIMEYVTRILTAVDDFDLIYTRGRASRRQLADVILKELAHKPMLMLGQACAADIRLAIMKSQMDRIFADALDRLTLQCMDRIVPLSNKVLNYLLMDLKLDIDRVSKPIPLSVDTHQFYPNYYPSELVVGYGGRISPEKGAAFLERLMFEARSEHLNFRVAGWIQTPIQFPDNSHYVGALDHSEMNDYLNSCSIMLMPSYTEGMCNAILESYCAGRPIMVTEGALTPEIPVFGWALPRDVNTWIKTLKAIDRDQAADLGAEARAWLLETWPSWEDFGSRMSAELATLLET